MAEEKTTPEEVTEKTKKVEKPKKLDTKNPFNPRVTYDMFLENVNGKTTVDSLLKKLNLDKDSLNWIKEELENHEKNKK